MEPIDQTLALLCAWGEEEGQINSKIELIAKMALLEVGGWLEITFDEIILKIARENNIDDEYVKNLLKKTNSFDYDSFRKMLISVVGEINVRKIEKRFINADLGNLEKLKAKLGDIKKRRDQFAHTYIESITQKNFIMPAELIRNKDKIQILIAKYQEIIFDVLRPLSEPTYSADTAHPPQTTHS